MDVGQQAPVVGPTGEGVSIDLNEPWGGGGGRRQVVVGGRCRGVCPNIPLPDRSVTVTVRPAPQEEVRQPLGTGLRGGRTGAEEGRRGRGGGSQGRGGERKGG